MIRHLKSITAYCTHTCDQFIHSNGSLFFPTKLAEKMKMENCFSMKFNKAHEMDGNNKDIMKFALRTEKHIEKKLKLSNSIDKKRTVSGFFMCASSRCVDN